MTKDGFTIGIGLNHGWQSPAATAAGWRDPLALIDGRADFLTLHDPFGEAATGFDATLLAARLGPLARDIALIPGVALNRAEPFHTATGIATLDYVTQGRAGLLVQSATGGARALGALNGYPPEDPAEQAQDLHDAIEAVRRLWDSWQDDAVIRDTVSQRFLDAGRLHPIRYQGRHFSVQGPSITPRPPQGQPPVLVAAHDPVTLRQAVDLADVILLDPGTRPPAEVLAQARQAAAVARAGAGRSDLRFLLDVVVDFHGAAPSLQKAARWSGGADDLSTAVDSWREEGFHGIRLLPRDPARDLPPLTQTLLAATSRAPDLRGRFGLDRPANRFAA